MGVLVTHQTDAVQNPKYANRRNAFIPVPTIVIDKS
jgi:hypothetical protein